jgi:hypothetical protein
MIFPLQQIEPSQKGRFLFPKKAGLLQKEETFFKPAPWKGIVGKTVDPRTLPQTGRIKP